MTNKIYDFEQDRMKKVNVGPFDTQNIGPDLELLQKNRERERALKEQELNGRTSGQHEHEAVVQQPYEPINPPQKIIEIEDSIDDDFTQQDRAIEKTLTTELALAEDMKKKRNWYAILFFCTSLILAASLIFVSMKFFAQVAENTKMKQTVQEAEDIKKTSNSKIETLTKQKEDVDAKFSELKKETEALQKKYDEALVTANSKQGQVDEANRALAAAKAQIDEANKAKAAADAKAAELQAQIDAIKKAAGA